MKDSTFIYCMTALISIAIIIVCWLIWDIAYSTSRFTMEKDAIAHGHAEYFYSEDGSKHWRWKP